MVAVRITVSLPVFTLFVTPHRVVNQLVVLYLIATSVGEAAFNVGFVVGQVAITIRFQDVVRVRIGREVVAAIRIIVVIVVVTPGAIPDIQTIVDLFLLERTATISALIVFVIVCAIRIVVVVIIVVCAR